MENNLKCEKTIMINAPVTQVWKALTNADIVKKYFFGNEVFSEWNVGNSIMFKGDIDGEAYLGRGIILNRVPYKLFRFSYWSSLSGVENKSENYLHVTYHLSEEGDDYTELITTVDRIHDENMKEQLDKNLDKVLTNLKRVVEQETSEAVFG